MKFITRNLNLIGLFLLASFATAAAALYFHGPQPIQTARAKTDAPTVRYTCPMHPNITGSSPAACSKCGMNLVAIGGKKAGTTTDAHKDGCCAEKPVVVEASPAAMACPHLAAKAAQVTQTQPVDACCPKPATP